MLFQYQRPTLLRAPSDDPAALANMNLQNALVESMIEQVDVSLDSFISLTHSFQSTHIQFLAFKWLFEEEEE